MRTGKGGEGAAALWASLTCRASRIPIEALRRSQNSVNVSQMSNFAPSAADVPMHAASLGAPLLGGLLLLLRLART